MRQISYKVKAVIFDMDGVITDTMPFHFRVWKKVFAEQGLQVNECEIYMREGQPGLVTIEEIFKQHKRIFSSQEARAILARKEKMFKAIVHRRFIPGANNLLNFLKKRGIRLALVTGTARPEAKRIMSKALLGLFSVTVTGDEVRKGKPHPEPYLVALKKLKMKPSQALVIENAPFGIQSAKRAKLICLAVETSLPKSYLKEADHVFPSLHALRKKVRFIAVCG